jgi:RNA polymerase sigma factor (sigma-70 family)
MWQELQGLVARIRSGDREAFDVFVRIFGEHIRAIARERIGQLRIELETEPDEILDATVLELCRRWERIKAIQAEELVNYVKRVVRSQANEVWRRSRSLKRGSGRKGRQVDDYFDVPDPRDRLTTDIDLDDAISSTYQELTGYERLISMLYRSGWSWDEIAARLDMKPDAARKRWERAVARVLRRLD